MYSPYFWLSYIGTGVGLGSVKVNWVIVIVADR